VPRHDELDLCVTEPGHDFQHNLQRCSHCQAVVQGVHCAYYCVCEVWGARLTGPLQDEAVVPDFGPISAGDLCLDATAQSLDLSSIPGGITTEPFQLVRADIKRLSGNIQGNLGVDHPALASVAEYFFANDGGKKIRPALVLLISQAASATSVPGDTEAGAVPYLNAEAAFHRVTAHPQYRQTAFLPLRDEEEVRASQMRLAEITEMIHTASLLHDDVIDGADTRRGIRSVNSVFGNKLAILAGDFLLARASICLARLRDVPVIETMSTIIEHLVKGEVMQMKSIPTTGSESERHVVSV
jgi:hypothetical protein